MSSARLSRRALMKAAALAGGVAAVGLPQALWPATAEAYAVPSKMDWWYQARFGMFIHFGSYSQLGQGEWAFDSQQWSKANYQTQVTRTFDPARFNAATIAELAENAGMKYVVITAKHHEGYAMWNSDVASFTDTTATKLYNLHDYNGIQSDPLRDLKSECENRGIKFCLYYSILDWNHPSQTDRHEGGLTTMSSQAARTAYIADMKAQLQELLDRYDPALLWFDGDWFDNPAGPTLEDWWLDSDGVDLYNWLIARKPGLIVNERVKRDHGLGDYAVAEFGIPSAPMGRPWERCSTMNGAWGYNASSENAYRSLKDIVQELVTVVSRDGNLLLNIGPKGDGSVTTGTQTVLNGLASWMSTYSDSIHGTSGSPFAAEPSWGKVTRKSGKLFAHVFTWPANGRLRIPMVDNTISRVHLLDNPSVSLPYTVTDQIDVTVRATAPNANDAVVCVEVQGMPVRASALVFQNVDYDAGRAVLPLGGYTSAQLSAAGLAPATASSILLPPGFQLTGYSGDNFTGTAWTFTADTRDLRVTGNNDAIRSLRVTFRPDKYFRLTNVTNHLALDGGGNAASGSNLKLWEAVVHSNLQWQAIELGNGYYRLVNRTNGMVADGWGATANGDPARQKSWDGGNTQQWQITHRGQGRYSIANRSTGLVLDGGGTVASGSTAKQWTWQQNNNLLWTFDAVT
ncbi:alpha-L-fucosidase [Streptomyces scabiei]|uniref:alpha-L-fucosidase n=1 Tax=Streptomyces scabiei TaxID=1930 RepID=UPI001B315AE2|nr:MULTISPECIES: alpha-L-fucosidase [Streptomyces]MBP5871999.1 twin-arginine translocation signal domain-containing protein [Streptomyces sp. LBUM 1485]MDX3026663.1 alpha-L-fucosidase [Streptomyces scabiei]MDX3205766.1 alpha-L-fucosidase [Streptomyces scabiei]QTU58550.1 twin-arginine translocation signal domain-containing protein [Streptomyces sp. LBUM 1480]